ncbi:MAG TPA: hypothetical protein VK817_17695 [Trebonia sp.]|nr:hypothetical protein [Trebonia sp.]
MADSGALRVRRARAHAAGDHSLCRRCAALRGEAVPPRLISITPAPAPEAKFDAAAEMRQLAARMAEAHRADPSNAPLARELRMTLAELMPKASGKPDADLTGLFSALQA